MDTDERFQFDNDSVPTQGNHSNPRESTEHIVRPEENQKQKKRPRESDTLSTDSDDSSSDLGPEELELIENERKMLKKCIRHLAQLASKGKKTSISDSTNNENKNREPTSTTESTSSNMPTGAPMGGGSVGQQMSSHSSSNQPLSTRERSDLPTPTEPQARNQNVGSIHGTADRLQPDVQLPAESARHQAVGPLTPIHHADSQEPRDTPALTVNSDLIYNEADLPDEAVADYGQAVHVPEAEDLFATKYYPNRDVPLKMPTGMVTKQAYAFRYNGLESAEVMANIQAIQKRAEDCPAVYHNALKSSAKGNFDAQVHWWLTPVFRNYHLLGEDRQGRSRYLHGTVLPDLFKQFPDLHPDYIKVQDTKMEKAYLHKLCLSPARTRRANAKNKPVDKMTALIRGVPFATHVLRRLGDLAEVPIAILIGAPDPQDSSKLVIYHDTFGGPAPAHIEDFWSGPNQLGTGHILPLWRRFVANVYDKPVEAIRAEPQALPEFVVPSEDAPADELPERVVYCNGIRFVVTPPPDNWCIRSPERDDIINNLRTALSESWKETFGKGRVDFSAMRDRTFDFTSKEYLPRSLKRIEEGPGGIMTLVKAVEPALCVPSDPRNMEAPVLEAWYHMFVDDSIPEDRRFRWVNKNFGVNTTVSKSKRGTNKSKKAKGKSQSEVPNPLRAPRSAEDDTARSDDEDVPDYPGESETSAGDGPTEPRLRAPTVSKSGRISSAPKILAPLNSSRNRIPSPADMPSTDATVDTASQGVLTSPQKDAPTRMPATDIHALFSFHPPNDQYPSHLPPDSIDQINSSEYFRHIPSPNANAIPGITLPHLSDLIIRCIDLDLLFPLENVDSRSCIQTALKQPCDPISTLWAILENPDKPLPTYLFTLQLCRKSDEPFRSAVLDQALQHLSAQIEALEGCNLCTFELGSAPTFEPWTTPIIITARFLSFLYSMPQKEVPLYISTQLERHNARLVEIVCMYLAYRYTSSTVARFMASHPNATSPATIASTVQTLGMAWLNSTSTLLNPLNGRRLSTVIGTSKLKDIEPGLPSQELPFFELQDAAKRWLVVERTAPMEDAMVEFAMQVERSTKVLKRLSIYEQFVVIGVIIGQTLNPNRDSSDANWLLVVDTMVVALDKICGTSTTYEREHAPAPPPPTMAPSTNSDTPSLTRPSAPSENRDLRPQDNSTQRRLQHDGVHDDAPPNTSLLPSTSGQSTEIDPHHSQPKRYSRPKSRIGGRTRWVVGDVIKFPLGGFTKKVRIRQKGPDPKALVVTWLESREPVLSRDGAPIPLPAFDKDLLITPGPIMPALDLDCFIREQPLPPLIPFNEILSGKHDEYFRELFAMNPEDPPLSSESDYDEIDDLPDDLKLRALRERISRRRAFRDLFCLPPDSQDLEDEADVQSLLGSAAQAPSHHASSYAQPNIPDSRTAPSNSRRDVSPSDPRPAVPEPEEPLNPEVVPNATPSPSHQGDSLPGHQLAASKLPESSSDPPQDLSAGGKPSKRKPIAPTASDPAENDISEDEPTIARPEKPSPPAGLTPRRSTRPKNPPPAPVATATTKVAAKSRTATAVSPENIVGEAEAIPKKGGSAAKGKAKSSTQKAANASHQAQGTSTGMKTRSRSTAMQADTDAEEPPAKKPRNKR